MNSLVEYWMEKEAAKPYNFLEKAFRRGKKHLQRVGESIGGGDEVTSKLTHKNYLATRAIREKKIQQRLDEFPSLNKDLGDAFEEMKKTRERDRIGYSPEVYEAAKKARKNFEKVLSEKHPALNENLDLMEDIRRERFRDKKKEIRRKLKTIENRTEGFLGGALAGGLGSAGLAGAYLGSRAIAKRLKKKPLEEAVSANKDKIKSFYGRNQGKLQAAGFGGAALGGVAAANNKEKK